ncbi:uncharacterized protein LOC126264889 [Aethina tumida]|uniref:uncharacterized protein LOC126264889 n=1 Tax=Aethina tumida TaxID=116153 RepID=UPI00214754F1|nr:uncharacterized protein LOC126264889 [Aethina tumida]
MALPPQGRVYFKINEKTIGQFNNPNYLTERMHRLTASNFGDVIKLKESTSCDSIVKKILRKNNFSTEATKYGKINETVAIKKFEEEYNKIVKPAGLFVDVLHGYLGASPDGIISEDEIVVKCSYKTFKSGYSLEEGIIRKQIPYLSMKDNKIALRKNHEYYYQIQGQLNIIGAKRCYFIVYSGPKNKILVEVFPKDEDFWINKMLPKLERFFLNCLGPEIILNRRGRNLKCLDPPYIREAQEKKKK